MIETSNRYENCRHRNLISKSEKWEKMEDNWRGRIVWNNKELYLEKQLPWNTTRGKCSY